MFSVRVFWNRTKALFFLRSKGHVRHSFDVFFASCWRSGVVEPDQSIVCYGFQKSREAFFRRVFCLAWARILLVFRSFRIWRWRDFQQPSFGIHVSNGFLLGRGSTAAGVRVFRNRSFVCFLWVPKVTWSILSACFLLGMGSNLAGVSVFSNLTLTRLWAAIVRNPRFERFFAWQRLDCCWRSGVSEPKLCFLWVPKVTWSILSACFLLGMGSNLAGVSVFSNLTLTRLWAAIVRNPRSCLWLYVRFERFFAWQRLDCCWRSGVSFFMGSKGDVKHSVCVFFAWHGLASCWCFGLFESDADETFSSHRSESTFRTVFCLAEARLLLAFGCFVF